MRGLCRTARRGGPTTKFWARIWPLRGWCHRATWAIIGPDARRSGLPAAGAGRPDRARRPRSATPCACTARSWLPWSSTAGTMPCASVFVPALRRMRGRARPRRPQARAAAAIRRPARAARPTSRRRRSSGPQRVGAAADAVGLLRRELRRHARTCVALDRRIESARSSSAGFEASKCHARAARRHRSTPARGRRRARGSGRPARGEVLVAGEGPVGVALLEARDGAVEDVPEQDGLVQDVRPALGAARSSSSYGSSRSRMSSGWSRKSAKRWRQPRRRMLAANAAGWRIMTSTRMSNVSASHSGREERDRVLHERRRAAAPAAGKPPPVAAHPGCVPGAAQAAQLGTRPVAEPEHVGHRRGAPAARSRRTGNGSSAGSGSGTCPAGGGG